MHYIVEEIEFDFEDSQGTIDEDEQQFITENAIGLWWVDSEWADPEDALIEKITDKTGWCVKSIKYCENRPHRLTSLSNGNTNHTRSNRYHFLHNLHS